MRILQIAGIIGQMLSRERNLGVPLVMATPSASQ